MHADIVIEVRDSHTRVIPSLGQWLARQTPYDAAAYVSVARESRGRSVYMNSGESPQYVRWLPSITASVDQAFAAVPHDDAEPIRSMVVGECERVGGQRTDHIVLGAPSFDAMVGMEVDPGRRFLIETSVMVDDFSPDSKSLDALRQHSTHRLLASCNAPYLEPARLGVMLATSVDLLVATKSFQPLLSFAMMNGVDGMLISHLDHLDPLIAGRMWGTPADVVESRPVSDMIRQIGQMQFVSESGAAMPELFIPSPMKLWLATGLSDESISGPFTWRGLFDAGIAAGHGVLNKMSQES